MMRVTPLARRFYWCGAVFAATKPLAATAAYVNFRADEGGGRLNSTYGQNFAVGATVKARSDCGIMDRVNRTIRP